MNAAAHATASGLRPRPRRDRPARRTSASGCNGRSGTPDHGKRGRYTGQRTDAAGKACNIVGWEYVHIAIDDATRLAYVEL
jgi:hypothetical protein